MEPVQRVYKGYFTVTQAHCPSRVVNVVISTGAAAWGTFKLSNKSSSEGGLGGNK